MTTRKGPGWNKKWQVHFFVIHAKGKSDGKMHYRAHGTAVVQGPKKKDARADFNKWLHKKFNVVVYTIQTIKEV